jgi:hypothetical protein
MVAPGGWTATIAFLQAGCVSASAIDTDHEIFCCGLRNASPVATRRAVWARRGETSNPWRATRCDGPLLPKAAMNTRTASRNSRVDRAAAGRGVALPAPPVGSRPCPAADDVGGRRCRVQRRLRRAAGSIPAPRRILPIRSIVITPRPWRRKIAAGQAVHLAQCWVGISIKQCLMRSSRDPAVNLKRTDARRRDEHIVAVSRCRWTQTVPVFDEMSHWALVGRPANVLATFVQGL